MTRWQDHTTRANSRASSGGKGKAALRGTLTGTAHGASLHNEAAGHGERAHDQEDNARHYSVKEREEVRDALAWRGEVKALKGAAAHEDQRDRCEIDVCTCNGQGWG